MATPGVKIDCGYRKEAVTRWVVTRDGVMKIRGIIFEMSGKPVILKNEEFGKYSWRYTHDNEKDALEALLEQSSEALIYAENRLRLLEA